MVDLYSSMLSLTLDGLRWLLFHSSFADCDGIPEFCSTLIDSLSLSLLVKLSIQLTELSLRLMINKTYNSN